jgi:hypothetical protein
MASAKRTPKVSRISRGRTLAYARKQKPAADGGADSGPEDPADDAPATGTDEADAASDATAAAPPSGTTSTGTEPAETAPAPAASVEPPAASVEPPAAPPPESAPAAPPPESAPAAARPDAAPPDLVEPEPVVARVATTPMPAQVAVGAPPAMPPAASSSGPATGAAEDPTRMPGPREIPAGHPDDPASPPGRVPPGDSRSLRRRVDRHEFALVYRQGSFVISRVGAVGTRGQWRVVEYPTPSMASHAYAKECSRFVSDGFSDYRE